MAATRLASKLWREDVRKGQRTPPIQWQPSLQERIDILMAKIVIAAGFVAWSVTVKITEVALSLYILDYIGLTNIF
jgi:hypothetical protein